MNTVPKDERKKALERFVLRIVVVALSMSVISGLSKAVLRHWDVPTWGRVLLAFSPLLPLLFLRKPSTIIKADELAMRIHQESTVFAFYGLFVVILISDLLLKAGVVTEFIWRHDSLVIAMVLLLGLGHAWTARRYR